MTTGLAPAVSVVIPCYNQGRFLADAIESALAQTFPHVEVVVVNDGSTDMTAAVARGYESVRYFESSRRGAAEARNAGLAASRGEFLIFLDADDRLLPDAVTNGLESLSAHPDWAFVTGHVGLINADGVRLEVPPQDHDGAGYVDLLRANYIWTPGAVMYRRRVLDAVGAFDTAAGGSADYELNLRIARRYAFGCHHRAVLDYRQHGANMSADAAHMLRSAVSVRRAQWPHVRSDAAGRAALSAGLARVRSDFGVRLVDQIIADVRVQRQPMRAMRGLLDLLQYYPAGLRHLMTAGLRWARRRCW